MAREPLTPLTKAQADLIAGVIADTLYGYELTRREAALDFADALERADPKFNRKMFLKACGV